MATCVLLLLAAGCCSLWCWLLLTVVLAAAHCGVGCCSLWCWLLCLQGQLRYHPYTGKETRPQRVRAGGRGGRRGEMRVYVCACVCVCVCFREGCFGGKQGCLLNFAQFVVVVGHHSFPPPPLPPFPLSHVAPHPLSHTGQSRWR